MEGVTDSAFRQLCHSYGADVVYTEFVSSDAIDHRAPSALRKLDFDPSEQPVVAQIFGRNPDAFRRAAIEIEARGFSGIDINFGCPARKVMSHGSGVSLMRDPAFARRLIEAVTGAVDIPVSIKVRASIRKESKQVDPGCTDRVTALDLVEAIRDLPVSAIMIHGRSFEQGFSGAPDTAMIRQIKQRFNGLVLANGGIHTVDDARQILLASEADGIGVARGSLGRPWIFSTLAAGLRDQANDLVVPNLGQTILDHARLLTATKGSRAAVELRKHLAAYVTGLPNASNFRRRLSSIETMGDVETYAADVGLSLNETAPATIGRSC